MAAKLLGNDGTCGETFQVLLLVLLKAFFLCVHLKEHVRGHNLRVLLH